MKNLFENLHVRNENALAKTFAYAITDCEDPDITLIDELQDAIDNLKNDISDLESELDRIQKSEIGKSSKEIHERVRLIWTIYEISAAIYDGYEELSKNYISPENVYQEFKQNIKDLYVAPEYVIFKPVPEDSDSKIGVMMFQGGNNPTELVETFIHQYDPHEEILESTDTTITATNRGETVKFPIYTDLKYSTFEHEDGLIVAKIPPEVYNAYIADFMKYTLLYDD